MFVGGDGGRGVKSGWTSLQTKDTQYTLVLRCKGKNGLSILDKFVKMG